MSYAQADNATKQELSDSLDAAVRREQKVLGQRDAFSKGYADKCQRVADLEATVFQLRAYINDALLQDEEDVGVIRDILHGALDVGS